MENNILKIDLDLKVKRDAISLLKKRLSYMHDLNFLNFEGIVKIELLMKSAYGCRIILKDDFWCYVPINKKWAIPLMIINLQLILGSDALKEINTTINHYKLNMKYSNRLFEVKRYPDGTIKKANIIDVTAQLKKYIYDTKRKKNYN